MYLQREYIVFRSMLYNIYSMKLNSKVYRFQENILITFNVIKVHFITLTYIYTCTPHVTCNVSRSFQCYM